MPVALTSEQQDARYGELLPDLRAAARMEYSNLFEFHPYLHARRVASAAVGRLTRLEDAGAADLPSHFTLEYAGEMHDAGLAKFYGVDGHVKLDPNPYACPEDLSIHIAKKHGREKGIDEATLDEVGEDIGTTKAGVRARSWGGFLLCLSDIESAGGDFNTVFMVDGAKLRREWLLVKGEISAPDYKDFSVWLMSKYIFTNLRGAESFSRDIEPVEFFAPEINAIQSNVTLLAKQRAHEDNVSIDTYAHACFPKAGTDRNEIFQLLDLRAA